MHMSATFVGRLGRDPETKQTQNGKPMTTFSVACDSGFGQNKETTWVKVTTFGKNAENCARFLSKGSAVAVESSRISAYASMSQTGEPRATLQAVADKVTFLSIDGQQQQQRPKSQQPTQERWNYDDDDEIPF